MHKRAVEVAIAMGVDYVYIEDSHRVVRIECTSEEFCDGLAALKIGGIAINRAAYERLQREG